MRFAPRIALVRCALSACAVKTNTIYHIFSGLSKLLPNGFAKFALKFKYAAKRAGGALYSASPRQKFRRYFARCRVATAATSPLPCRRNFAAPAALPLNTSVRADLKYTGARHAPRALQVTLKIATCAHFVSLSSASLYSLKHFSIFSKVMYSSAWCMVLSSPASSGPNAAPCFSALA